LASIDHFAGNNVGFSLPLPTTTFTHFLAVVSKAVPALQALHDFRVPASVTKSLHWTHFAAAASQAIAALQAVAEVKVWAPAVVAPTTAATNIDAARTNVFMQNSPFDGSRDCSHMRR
jgi:hypothetical protein